MDEQTRQDRTLDALETIAAELEMLRVLREYELAVSVEYEGGGGGPCATPAERWAERPPGRGTLTVALEYGTGTPRSYAPGTPPPRLALSGRPAAGSHDWRAHDYTRRHWPFAAVFLCALTT